jgi:hypothetical protein
MKNFISIGLLGLLVSCQNYDTRVRQLTISTQRPCTSKDSNPYFGGPECLEIAPHTYTINALTFTAQANDAYVKKHAKDIILAHGGKPVDALVEHVASFVYHKPRNMEFVQPVHQTLATKKGDCLLRTLALSSLLSSQGICNYVAYCDTTGDAKPDHIVNLVADSTKPGIFINNTHVALIDTTTPKLSRDYDCELARNELHTILYIGVSPTLVYKVPECTIIPTRSLESMMQKQDNN